MSKFTRAEERNLGKTFSYMLVVIYQERWNSLIHILSSNACIVCFLCHQLKLVRLKHPAAVFNSFSAISSRDCVGSFNDDSGLHPNSIRDQLRKILEMQKWEFII